MDFVVLRSVDGERLVNVDHIISFENGPFNNTKVVNLTSGKSVSITEIPVEILASVKNIPAEIPKPAPDTTPKPKKPLSES